MKEKARHKMGIPVMSEAGLASPVSQHYGKAPMHLVVQTLTGEVLAVLGKPDGHHGKCAPIEALLGYGVDCVVSRGMGRGARNRLEEAGVEVLRTEGRTLGEVLEAFRRGDLAGHEEGELCRGGH